MSFRGATVVQRKRQVTGTYAGLTLGGYSNSPRGGVGQHLTPPTLGNLADLQLLQRCSPGCVRERERDRPLACGSTRGTTTVCVNCNSRTRCVVFYQDQSLSLSPGWRLDTDFERLFTQCREGKTKYIKRMKKKKEEKQNKEEIQ